MTLKRMNNNINGILLVNKPVGFTSRDVINKLNKHFHTKKMGHTGTLDPIASGVLIVCIGKYTKLVDHLTSLKKEYIAKVKLGYNTDTLDITGNILNQKEIKSITNLDTILNSFLGNSMQQIPLYSAKKINGKKLYEYARENIEIELPTKEIEISEIKLLEQKNDSFTFQTTVSKGTFIRSLIQDICIKTNNFGTMEALTRTKQGNFVLEECYSLESILNDNYKLLTLTDIFDYPVIEVDEEIITKVMNGNKLQFALEDPFLILKKDKQIIALYQKHEDEYKIILNLFDKQASLP